MRRIVSAHQVAEPGREIIKSCRIRVHECFSLSLIED